MSASLPIPKENVQVRSAQIKETPEIERLTDIIFGLALSIGALVLISQPPHNLNEILIDLLGFTYAFFILIVIWTRYTTALALVRIESAGQVRLNFVLLFLVALEPYFFFLLASGPMEFVGGQLDDIASMLYALNLGALMAILAFFSDRIAKNTSESIHPVEVRRHIAYRFILYSSAIILALSALPIFWDVSFLGIPLRYFIWVVPLMLIVVGGGLAERQFRGGRRVDHPQ